MRAPCTITICCPEVFLLWHPSPPSPPSPTPLLPRVLFGSWPPVLFFLWSIRGYFACRDVVQSECCRLIWSWVSFLWLTLQCWWLYSSRGLQSVFGFTFVCVWFYLGFKMRGICPWRVKLSIFLSLRPWCIWDDLINSKYLKELQTFFVLCRKFYKGHGHTRTSTLTGIWWKGGEKKIIDR